MTNQFLVHTMDVKRNKLIDKLALKGVLFSAERQRLKEQKRTDVRVDVLLMMLRTKSPAQFDSFLTSLSETGQQPIADVVRQALCTVGQTGYNPLQHLYGKIVYSVLRHGLECTAEHVGPDLVALYLGLGLVLVSWLVFGLSLYCK